MGQIKARDIIPGWPRGHSTVPPLRDWHYLPTRIYGFAWMFRSPEDWPEEWFVEFCVEQRERLRASRMMQDYWNDKMVDAAGAAWLRLRTGWHTESQIAFMRHCAELEKRYHEAVDRVLS